MQNQNSTNIALTLVIMSIVIYFMVTNSTVRNTGSDSQGSLLLSQTIIQDQTIKLDKYKGIIYKYNGRIYKKNEHYYYYFPIGSSIFALPFVAFENIIGLDMLQHEDEAQIRLAGLISVAIFLLLYLIAMLYIEHKWSLILASLFWFGSSLSSTLGTALWSHNFAILFSLIALYFALKSIKEQKPIHFIIISFSLFAAYLCRPTLSLLSPAIILFIYFHSKQCAFKIAGLLSLMLGAFILFSFHEFGQILPDYYIPKRLSGEHFWTALYGNLFSPSRGLFIYSSFLIFPLIFYRQTKKILQENISLVFILLLPLIHLISISQFPHWWAGHSYGARFMSDVIPAFYLIFILVFHQFMIYYKNNLIKTFLYIFLLTTGIFSIYINAFQGLYNNYTANWNANPNIDIYPKYLFDWKYPQFIHNLERHRKRILEHELESTKNVFVTKKLPNTAFRSEIVCHSQEIKLEEFFSRYIDFDLEVHNKSSEWWPQKSLVKNGNFVIRIRSHLYNEKQKLVYNEKQKLVNQNFPYGISNLPYSISPNSKFTVPIFINKNVIPKGISYLEYDLVQEGYTWFQGKGGKTCRIKIIN